MVPKILARAYFYAPQVGMCVGAIFACALSTEEARKICANNVSLAIAYADDCKHDNAPINRYFLK